MDDTLIKVEDLCKIYNPGENEVRALDHVSLEIKKGELVAIIGQSGSGKSTFMNMLGCLDVPTSGKYYLNGTDVSEMSDNELSEVRNREIGFIFQGFNLIANLNAIENVELPLIYRGIDRKTRHQLAIDSLKMVGLEKRMDHKPSEMSGGQQQRVAIARAIAAQPPVILADEPTGSVALVQHYPKIIPVMLLSRSTRISDMTERQSVRFSSRVRESYMLLKSACNILSTAEKSGGVSSGASSGICCRAAVYIW